MRPNAIRTARPSLVAAACLTLGLVAPASAAEADPPDGSPQLAFSTYLGGEYFDYAMDIAVDGAGNTYVVGHTQSATFPTRNALQPVYSGVYPDPDVLAPIPNRNQDAFVSKLDPQGRLVYSTYLGGTKTDAALAVAVDAAGNALVGGVTTSRDFPTKDALQPTVHAGTLDAFVTKLDPGGSIVWSTYFGSAPGPHQAAYHGDDFVRAIAVDPSGRAAIGGWTGSTAFPTTETAAQRSFGGSTRDGWVAMLSADGRELAYSSYLGGSQPDSVTALAFGTIDPEPDEGIDVPPPVAAVGNLVVAGETESADFPVTEGAYDRTFEGTHDPDATVEGDDAYVSSLRLAGGPPAYGTFVGGGVGASVGFILLPAEQVRGIDIGPDGSVHVAGYTQASDFPTTPGAFQRKLQDSEDLALFEGGDGYAFALEPRGRTLAYSTYLGAERTDYVDDIDVDGVGRAHLIGWTTSQGFPVTADAMQPRRSNEENHDVYNEVVCAGPGGPVMDELLGDGACEGAGRLVLGDVQDAFYTSLEPDGSRLAYSTFFGGWLLDLADGIALGPGGTVTFAGYTESLAYPGRRAAQPVFRGATDAMVTRLSPSALPPCDVEVGPICHDGA